MASPSALTVDDYSAPRAAQVQRERRAPASAGNSSPRTPLPRHERTAQRLSLIGGSVVGVIATAALLGWATGLDPAKRWLPAQVAMNPLTACCFIALAFSLFVLSHKKGGKTWKIVGRATAGLVVVITSLKLASIAGGWQFAADQWLFGTALAAEPGVANRMATRTALAFVLAGAALLFLDAKVWRGVRPAELLAFLAGIVGLLSLLGYAYGVLSYHLVPNFVPVALPSALGFFVLASAILFARVESGVMSIVFSDTAGGFVARRLVPLALLMPVVLGALRLLGQNAGWYDTTMGVAHLASAFVVVFLTAIAWTAWLLFTVDRERSVAEAARVENEARLHELNAELERRVAGRTAELREANAQLHESGRIARQTLDALSAHIAIVDENGTVVNVNEAWRAFAAENAGPLPKTLIGVNYLQICDHAAGADAEIARAFAAGVRAVLEGSQRSFVLEYPCHAPRQQRWFVGRVTRFGGSGAKMAAIAHEDVTVRKQAEESLRFQAHLLKNSGEAVIATDLEGTVIYMNDFAEEMYGWPAAEALGRNVFEISVPEISRAQATEIFASMCEGEGWRGEFVVHRRDGTTFPVSVTNTALRDEHGSVTGIVGMSRDISERKQAEAALRDSEERFRQLAENVQDVFWLVDVGYRTTIYVSPAYERIWGRTRESLTAGPKSFMEPILPEDRDAVRAYSQRQLEGAAEVEYRIRRPDGSIRWIHDRAFPVRGEDGKIFRIAGIARDISSRKQAQISLKQSEAELRALATRLNAAREEEAARIARELHDELGQAMAGMTMDLSAAQRQLAGAEMPGAAEVQRRLVQMRTTLDQTIAATRRICTELRPALLDQFGLLPAIEWQVNDFENRSEIFCNLTMCEFDPPITGESATAIFRILQELLTNVARHAAATEVCVDLACHDSGIQLVVQDNGRGIPAAAEQQSLGFGLIGIRERALAVGGQVVVSGEPGVGTRVVVTIPERETEQHVDAS